MEGRQMPAAENENQLNASRRFERARRVSNISQALRAIAIQPDDAENEGQPSAGSATGSGILVRPIEGEAELDAVYRLTYDSFLERGYCAPRPDRRLIHYPHLDRLPETMICVAISEGQIVGTVSVTLDGPQ